MKGWLIDMFKKSVEFFYSLFVVGVIFITIFVSAFLTGMGEVSSAFGMMAVVMLYTLFLFLFERHDLEGRVERFVNKIRNKDSIVRGKEEKAIIQDPLQLKEMD